MLTRIVAAALFSLLVLGDGSGPAARLPAAIDDAITNVTAAELRAHVEVLASDQLAGRGLGHAGNREAERYIIKALRTANVPAAAPEYLQPVDVYEPRLGQDCRLTISGPDGPLAELVLGADLLPLTQSSDLTATGPLLFVGHGISAPNLHHDDYAGIHARGAVVLALEEAPGRSAGGVGPDERGAHRDRLGRSQAGGCT